MKLSRLILRLLIGGLFIGHGTQKLFGWFGGHGLDGTGGFFESLGLKPGRRHATPARAPEAVGGALLTLGALTPVAAGLITGTMITAIRKAHLEKGPWVTNGGYEYNLTLIAAMLALTEAGPGRPSVDEATLPWLKGNTWELAQFTTAAVGSTLRHSWALARFNPPAVGLAMLPPERVTALEHPPAEGEPETGGGPAAPRQHR